MSYFFGKTNQSLPFLRQPKKPKLAKPLEGDSPKHTIIVCTKDNADPCKAIGSSLCSSDKCICIHTLEPPLFNQTCNQDIPPDEGHIVNGDIGVIGHETITCINKPCDNNSELITPGKNGTFIIGSGKHGLPDGIKIPSESKPAKSNTTPQQRKTDDQSDGDNHLQTIQIVAPIVSVVLLIAIIVLVIFIRRRRAIRSVPKSESPIAWLHRHDSFILLDSMTVVSKNPNYYTQNPETGLAHKFRNKQISKDKLHLLEEIGEGAFGKVYKGAVNYSQENVVKVAVKVLKEGATRETKEDFKREVEIMSSFEHENILRLIGVVIPTDEVESPYMVFEFMEHGDLAELLRKTDVTMRREEYDVNLKQTDLVDIATQISNGMVYLASQHFVHRDLATRNCLVGGELIVKISDFGMSRDIYTCDYYRIGGSRMLPVRWMSPESVKYGRFTTESDVWAYGVVLWEIFSYGKQPYYGHSNEEVIRFIEDGILLQKPEDCPSTIYHVMLGCWRSDPKDRFVFERIHRHLLEYSRKMVKCYHQLQVDVSEFIIAEV